jgi:hypothetical protein
VVIEALVAPVAFDHGHVQVPALHLGFAGFYGVEGARAEGGGG